KIGGRMRVPAATLARVLIATNEGVTLGSHVDGEDLFRPFLEMYTSVIKLPD
ncbi:TetR family transcriptional regulator, partial [Mycolicibacterium austroafricanum]